MMKSLRTLGVLSAAVVGLTACDPIVGTLTIIKAFTYENTASAAMIEFCKKHPTDYYCKDVDTQNPSRTFPAGSYASKLEFPSSSEIVLKLKNSDLKIDTQFKFKLPSGAKLPSSNGSFAYTAEQVKQQFGIRGNVETQVTDGSKISGSESCTIPVTRRLCERVEEGQPGDRRERREMDRERGRLECRDVTEYIPGSRDVEYFNRTTQKQVTMQLTEKKTNGTLANFSGSATDYDTIYTYQGRCISDRHF